MAVVHERRRRAARCRPRVGRARRGPGEPPAQRPLPHRVHRFGGPCSWSVPTAAACSPPTHGTSCRPLTSAPDVRGGHHPTRASSDLATRATDAGGPRTRLRGPAPDRRGLEDARRARGRRWLAPLRAAGRGPPHRSRTPSSWTRLRRACAITDAALAAVLPQIVAWRHRAPGRRDGSTTACGGPVATGPGSTRSLRPGPTARSRTTSRPTGRSRRVTWSRSTSAPGSTATTPT